MPEATDPHADHTMQLRSLAPRYEPEQHDVYVNALVDALREDGIRNVALTGAYGTGKSSVLQRLSEMEEFRERTLELSLSTVGVTETRPEGESDANPAAWTKTNLIQKEIVKQILYRDAPEKTRGSRVSDGGVRSGSPWVSVCCCSLPRGSSGWPPPRSHGLVRSRGSGN